MLKISVFYILSTKMSSLTASMTKEGSVLFVGLLCVDIVVLCDGYPQEDTDER